MNRKYLVLHYVAAPEVDYICEYDGNTRIRVTRFKSKIPFPSVSSAILAIGGGSLYLFEYMDDAGEKEDLIYAIDWYRKYLGLQDMKIIEAVLQR